MSKELSLYMTLVCGAIIVLIFTHMMCKHIEFMKEKNNELELIKSSNLREEKDKQSDKQSLKKKGRLCLSDALEDLM
jgi:hypothetical protein